MLGKMGTWQLVLSWSVQVLIHSGNYPQQITTQGQPGCSLRAETTFCRASTHQAMLSMLQVLDKCWVSRRMGKHVKEWLACPHPGHFQAVICTQGVQIDLTSA